MVAAEANADPALRLVAKSGPWHSPYGSSVVTTTWDIYEVAGSSLVQPLSFEPAVVRGLGQAQKSWLDPSVSWYLDPARWAVELAGSGPPSWPRIRRGDLSPPELPVAPTEVSDVETTDNTVTFRVSRPGTPVLVKVSYFPNWQASGANGPWRVTPNLMVVVPTGHRVTLFYGPSGANDLGEALTGLGLALIAGGFVVVLLRRFGVRGAHRALR